MNVNYTTALRRAKPLASMTRDELVAEIGRLERENAELHLRAQNAEALLRDQLAKGQLR